MTTLSTKDRYSGSLLGLACGDAVGTTVEFRSRGSFEPITDMVGGGPFGLAAGQWTDDTSMALCLAESLIRTQGFDPVDQMNRYLNWWTWGYNSSTGNCFDIGMTVRAALSRFRESSNPFSGSTDTQSAGNGSIMRLAPVALYFHPNVDEVVHFCAESSRTTHGAAEAIECCKLLGFVLHRCLSGVSKAKLLDSSKLNLCEAKVCAIAQRSYMRKTRDQVFGTGYSVSSLEAAMWCFETTSTFSDAVLTATNLGDDADTTAAIVGQIAGAYYGVQGIPQHWLAKLHMRTEIEVLAQGLLDAAWLRGSQLS